jgi:hypothetical protein
MLSLLENGGRNGVTERVLFAKIEVYVREARRKFRLSGAANSERKLSGMHRTPRRQKELPRSAIPSHILRGTPSWRSTGTPEVPHADAPDDWNKEAPSRLRIMEESRY